MDSSENSRRRTEIVICWRIETTFIQFRRVDTFFLASRCDHVRLEPRKRFLKDIVVFDALPPRNSSTVCRVRIPQDGHFVATTISVNNAFARRTMALTIIDAGHWLLAMLVAGLVLGLFG